MEPRMGVPDFDDRRTERKKKEDGGKGPLLRSEQEYCW